jgi:hemerythrin-like domain-containing protein
MNSLIGSSAAPSFDDPLEMLRACHGRIQAQCTTLKRLREHLATHGHDAQASQAAFAILRYFDTAGQHHHQDEEQDLFPKLRATQDGRAESLIARLLQEHQGMEAAWKNLRPLLLDIANDKAPVLDEAITQHFTELYAQHIELENTMLLPLAETLLAPEQLHEIGSRMAARRGVQLSAR